MTTAAAVTAAITAEYMTDLLARRAGSEGRFGDMRALRNAYYDLRREASVLGLDLPYAEVVAIRDAVKAQLGWTPEREPRYFAASPLTHKRSTVSRSVRS